MDPGKEGTSSMEIHGSQPEEGVQKVKTARKKVTIQKYLFLFSCNLYNFRRKMADEEKEVVKLKDRERKADKWLGEISETEKEYMRILEKHRKRAVYYL